MGFLGNGDIVNIDDMDFKIGVLCGPIIAIGTGEGIDNLVTDVI